jgi:hypothetical protein
MKTILLSTLAVLLGVWPGPASAADPLVEHFVTQEALVPGIIDFGDDRSRSVLEAPATIGVGEDFEIKIVTFGGGCEREGPISVIVSAIGANVMVYDLTVATRPDVICTAVLKRLTHVVTLRFEKPGDALIRVWGRRVGAETPPLGVPTVLEHQITVKG